LIRLAHIINPVKVTEKSELYNAQPITFESILKAKTFSKFNEEIELYTTQFSEDRDLIPKRFIVLDDLRQSVLDVNSKLSGKKLPLIRDILDQIDSATEAEFIIYTNMDIALMPHFYDFVFNKLEAGYDAIVINRRRISKKFNSVSQLPEMYSELGLSHPGFDCFIFRKEYIQKMILNDICVGISFLEVSLIHNLFCLAQNPLFIPDAHLTFHIGLDVLVDRKNEFYKHNRSIYFNKIQPHLKKGFELKKFPYGTLPFHKRAFCWVLNPSIFTRNYIELEFKSFGNKLKFYLDEIRWRILQR
jgi:hypothetical protein